MTKRKGDPARVAEDTFAQMQIEAFSGDPAIDALISGYQWSESIVTYSFYSDAVFGGDYYGSETVSQVSETVKAHYRQIFAWLNHVVDIEFIEVGERAPDTYGAIRIMLSDGPSYAYSYYPSRYDPLGVGGDIHLNPTYQHAANLNGWETPPGYHGYFSLVHELGHALGLKHAFEDPPVLPTEEDNQAYTVMTYTFSNNGPATFMTYDVMALQYLYGAALYQNNPTLYSFGTMIDRYTLDTAFLYDSAKRFKQTIWDSGGADTLDLSALESTANGYRIDMTPGGWLTRQDSYETTTFSSGVALCVDTLFENVVTSSSDDAIILNAQPNRVRGYRSDQDNGNDRIVGADASDTIDLADFRRTEVTQSRDEDDLLIDLNGYGAIRIVDHYIGDGPRLFFGNSPAPIYQLLLN